MYCKQIRTKLIVGSIVSLSIKKVSPVAVKPPKFVLIKLILSNYLKLINMSSRFKYAYKPGE